MTCGRVNLKPLRVRGNQHEQRVAVLGEPYVPRPLFAGFANQHGLVVVGWKLDRLGPRFEPEGNGARRRGGFQEFRQLPTEMLSECIDESSLAIGSPGWIDEVFDAEPDQFFAAVCDHFEQLSFPFWS